MATDTLVLQLDITLDNLQLVDKFEWDISDSRNSPEAFAETFAAESGLSGEFRCVGVDFRAHQDPQD